MVEEVGVVEVNAYAIESGVCERCATAQPILERERGRRREREREGEREDENRDVKMREK